MAASRLFTAIHRHSPSSCIDEADCEEGGVRGKTCDTILCKTNIPPMPQDKSSSSSEEKLTRPFSATVRLQLTATASCIEERIMIPHPEGREPMCMSFLKPNIARHHPFQHPCKPETQGSSMFRFQRMARHESHKSHVQDPAEGGRSTVTDAGDIRYARWLQSMWEPTSTRTLLRLLSSSTAPSANPGHLANLLLRPKNHNHSSIKDSATLPLNRKRYLMRSQFISFLQHFASPS
jgi:hypothetical protein